MRQIADSIWGYEGEVKREDSSLCLACRHLQVVQAAPRASGVNDRREQIATLQKWGCAVMAEKLIPSSKAVMRCSSFRVDRERWLEYAEIHRMNPDLGSK